MSDGAYPSNFAGEKQEWPVYITIGNLSLNIHQMPSIHNVIMVAILPIRIKNHNVFQNWLDEQRQTYREVLNEVLWQLFKCPMIIKNPRTTSGYYNGLCADGNFRHCKTVLAALLADCSERSNLHHLKPHVCFWCEYPKNELGHCVPSDMQYPWWDHNL
jgi:hypothetical protein